MDDDDYDNGNRPSKTQIGVPTSYNSRKAIRSMMVINSFHRILIIMYLLIMHE